MGLGYRTSSEHVIASQLKELCTKQRENGLQRLRRYLGRMHNRQLDLTEGAAQNDARCEVAIMETTAHVNAQQPPAHA